MAYFDHAATTPVLPEALAAWTAAAGRVGNASSVHASGRRARRTVEEARESIAQSLGARPGEVIFTSGGTEADNLALKGIAWARRAGDPMRRRVLVSAVEHKAVLDPAGWLAARGDTTVELLPVDASGRLDLAAFRLSIERDPASVALVSVMWANNEVGTVQPVAEVAELCRQYGIPVHSDAVQAVSTLPVAASLVDALTVSGHKLGAPVGVGVLVLGRDVDVVPVLHGGGQERDVRSGTLAPADAAALAAALRVVVAERDQHAARLATLRADAERRITAAVPEAMITAADAVRLPGISHLTFPGCEGDALLMLLDAAGVECSTGSACAAGILQPSHVLMAIGIQPQRARGSLRLSYGRQTTAADVDELLAALPPAVARARRAGLVATADRS
ncbi:MAG: cysteine desulfurase [Actinomycetota bacterium]|nr:MAG: cysteine desulfurase [Actinomycetota bacterium]